jgi:hypothetical protein
MVINGIAGDNMSIEQKVNPEQSDVLNITIDPSYLPDETSNDPVTSMGAPDTITSPETVDAPGTMNAPGITAAAGTTDADSKSSTDTEKSFKKDTVSKSWFCVFDNPQKYGYDGTPQEIVDELIETWVKDNPQRSCAVSYCISADGLPHVHAVFEDTTALRFSKIKKLYPSMHIEPTKGNKKDAEDYINKRGKFKEHGEMVIYINQHGEIKGANGQRNDLEVIEELIKQGLTPNQIFDLSIQYRKYARIVKDAYYRKRYLETPTIRPLTVFYHTGEAGSGKSYTRIELAEEHGEENIYTVSQFDSGYMDKYSGEPVLFIDELRGQIRYSQLLVLLDPQKHDIHARYGNICGLWNEVHITSVFPPERLYRDMINANTDVDTFEQLRRRIHYMCYHYTKNGEYHMCVMYMSDYVNYAQIKKRAGRNNDGSSADKIYNNTGTLRYENPVYDKAFLQDLFEGKQNIEDGNDLPN